MTVNLIRRPRGPMADLVDTRTVGHLESLDGRTEGWVDWSFRARAWFGMLAVGGRAGEITATALEAAEGHDGAIDCGVIPAGAEAVGKVGSNLVRLRSCG